MAWTTPETAVAGDVLTAAWLNQNVRDNTDALYQSIQRLGYQQRTTNYTVSSSTLAGAANIFSSSITFSADGSSAYRVELYCPQVVSATNQGSRVIVNLVDGSGTDLGRLGISGVGNGTSASQNPMQAVYWYTPSAGSVTLNVRAFYGTAAGEFNSGAGGAGALVPSWFAVYGPALT